MNIGFISESLPYLPSKGGFRLYGANLIRCLAQRNRIDLISLLREDDAEHVDWARQYCTSVGTIPTNGFSVPLRCGNFVSAYLWGKPLHHRKELTTMLHAGLATRQWDVLHVEGGFTGGLIPQDLPMPKVLSLHDSWTLRCEEMLRCSQTLRERLYYQLLRYQEPRYQRLVYPRFERCVTVAHRDRQAVQDTVPKANVTVIPYGIDVDYYHPLNVKKQSACLVFHGHLGYAPNIDAVMTFADEIFPLVQRTVPHAVFHIVAADPVMEVRRLASRPGVKLTVNPPDVRPIVCSASIYVCPMRFGTGMKNKMLEAMAMRLPIVCYPSALVGIECVQGQHVICSETPEQFAVEVIALLRDPPRAETIAAGAREIVESLYSWGLRAEAFEQIYADAIEEHKARR